MTTKPTKTDPNLLKLKVALAAGGLVATLIGAGLLGNQAGAAAAITTTSTPVVTNTTTTTSATGTTSALEVVVPESLDLNLEAIPTVAAPTVRQVAVANGRSSG